MVELGYIENGEDVILKEVAKEGYMKITFNRLHDNNGCTDFVYVKFMEFLSEAEQNDDIKCVVLTGNGRFFSSGACIQAGFDPMIGPLKSKKGSYLDPVGRFMSKIIAFPKPLIAIVNGPAIGVGFTILPHCDIVYASNKAYFSAPFSQLAVTPEFCSSILFPKIFGQSIANEILLLGRKITIQEAKHIGFVSEIYDCETNEILVDTVLKEKILPILEYPYIEESFVKFKKFIRSDSDILELEKIHIKEMRLLDERATSVNGVESKTSIAVKKMFAAAKARKNAKKKKKSSSSKL